MDLPLFAQKNRRAGAQRVISLVSIAEQAEQIQEQIDEVQIQL